jgi:tRNA(Ile)-lysidine synthetase-like protein
MRVELQPGKYVVAVSGGVDSVALLHALRTLPDVKLTVAHFDHGIRTDSDQDRKLVQGQAKQYGLPFVYQRGGLGPNTSEAVARDARYDFLRQVQKAVNAQAIITAHHQDDVLETAIINMLRGTGRKGITSLKSHRHLVRPLLAVPKHDVRAYAKDQGLVWREDSTNEDTALLRNYVRKIIVPKLGDEGRRSLLTHIGHLSVVNRAIDNHLMLYLHTQPSRQVLDRHYFSLLPHAVSLEVLAEWLRSHGITTFNTKLLESLVIKCKTLPPGKQIVIDSRHMLLIGNGTLALVTTQ